MPLLWMGAPLWHALLSPSHVGSAGVKFCYAVLCYAVLCYAMLCHAMLYHAMLWPAPSPGELCHLPKPAAFAAAGELAPAAVQGEEEEEEWEDIEARGEPSGEEDLQAAIARSLQDEQGAQGGRVWTACVDSLPAR